MADDILIDPAPEVLPEDLDSFRSEWIQEVRSKLPQQQRQETAQPPSQRPLAKALGQTAAQKAAVYRGRSTSPSKHASGSTSSELRHGTVEADNSNSHDRVEALSKEMAALELYRRGEDEERQGRLSESVRLYRKAIRMDHNVEQNIRQIERQRIKLAAATSTLVVRDAAPHAAPAGDEMDIVAKITAENPAFSIVPSEAQDGDAQQQAVGRHFVSLPAEVIVNILKWAVFMDLGLVVDLSLVCKRMFLLVREQSIWKFLCWQSLLDGQCFSLDDVRDRYALNWRNVWMEKPRVWLDGVYISRVNYLRTGFSETFNQPVLVVTYFRYLRLLPGNKFMIHTSTLEPKAIVRGFHPDAAIKDVMYGDWEWVSDNQVSFTWTDKGRPHIFNCILKIGQNIRGRHNKLHWVDYTTCRIDDPSSVYAFPKSQLRQFTFSKVKFLDHHQL